MKDAISAHRSGRTKTVVCAQHVLVSIVACVLVLPGTAAAVVGPEQEVNGRRAQASEILFSENIGVTAPEPAAPVPASAQSAPALAPVADPAEEVPAPITPSPIPIQPAAVTAPESAAPVPASVAPKPTLPPASVQPVSSPVDEPASSAPTRPRQVLADNTPNNRSMAPAGPTERAGIYTSETTPPAGQQQLAYQQFTVVQPQVAKLGGLSGFTKRLPVYSVDGFGYTTGRLTPEQAASGYRTALVLLISGSSLYGLSLLYDRQRIKKRITYGRGAI